MSNRQQLVIVSFNCKSLNSKLSEFKVYLYAKKPHIVCLSETWLVAEKVPNFINYKCYWKHRQGGRGGGIGVLVRNDILVLANHINIKPNCAMEVQCLKIKMKYFVLDILNIYNVPESNISINDLNFYVNQLSNFAVMIGDLNAHHPSWSFNNKRNASGDAIAQLLTNNDTMCLLTPPRLVTYVDFARGTPSTLDLCIVSSNLRTNSSLQTGPDLGSDHAPIEVLLNKQPDSRPMKIRPRWKLDGINWGQWSRGLPDINVDLDNGNLDEINSRIVASLKSSTYSIDRTSGLIIPKYSKPWWDSNCSKLVAMRRRARRRFLSHPTDENKQCWTQCANKAKRYILRCKQKSWESFVSSINSSVNSKEVYKKINALRGKKCYSNVVLEYNNLNITDSQRKADLFADYFQDVLNAPIPNLNLQNNMYFEIQNSIIEQYEMEYNLLITMAELDTAISALKETSPGHDDIHNYFIKFMNKNYKELLLQLYNKSWVE